MSINALMVSGSRNPDGQTARAAGAVMAGLAEKGADCRNLFLPTMDIQRCRQCDDDGWGICREGHKCVIEDDLEEVLKQMAAADVIVFATPVYMAEPAEVVKALADRMRRIIFRKTGDNPLMGKPAVGVSVAGGGGGGAPKCAWLLDGLLHSFGLDVQDCICVRRQNLEMKLPLLKDTGRWLATLVPGE